MKNEECLVYSPIDLKKDRGWSRESPDEIVFVPLFDSFYGKLIPHFQDKPQGITDVYRSGESTYLSLNGSVVLISPSITRNLFDSSENGQRFVREINVSSNTTQTNQEALSVIRSVSVDLEELLEESRKKLRIVGIHNLPTVFSDFYFPNSTK